MNGKIGVESVKGEGSTFWFTVVLEKQEGIVETVLKPPADIEGKRFLVVDDNATSREIIREILQQWQISPILASGDQEARQIIKKAAAEGSSIDLVLIDSDMPGSDGFTLAHWIKERNLMDNRVVLMLTFPHLKRKSELKDLGAMSPRAHNALIAHQATHGPPRLRDLDNRPDPAASRATAADSPSIDEVAPPYCVARTLEPDITGASRQEQ